MIKYKTEFLYYIYKIKIEIKDKKLNRIQLNVKVSWQYS